MITSSNASPAREIMSGDCVQSMVHDLRTPMTVIKGNLQMLLSGMMGQLSQDQILLLERSVGPLEELILMTENLLQSASLEKPGFALQLEETDLDKLLSETIDFYAIPFRQREMKIFREGNTFGTKLRVDAFWMKRVLNNLIWNAYKFTPDHGQVSISVDRHKDGLDLIVEDNGRGIPPEKLQTIFDKFVQTVPARDCKFGTGLGLWICKKILELHGGSIRVQSSEGKGTRFTITIPKNCLL